MVCVVGRPKERNLVTVMQFTITVRSFKIRNRFETSKRLHESLLGALCVCVQICL